MVENFRDRKSFWYWDYRVNSILYKLQFTYLNLIFILCCMASVGGVVTLQHIILNSYCKLCNGGCKHVPLPLQSHCMHCVRYAVFWYSLMCCTIPCRVVLWCKHKLSANSHSSNCAVLALQKCKRQMEE